MHQVRVVWQTTTTSAFITGPNEGERRQTFAWRKTPQKKQDTKAMHKSDAHGGSGGKLCALI